jgi:invasion protein IalB
MRRIAPTILAAALVAAAVTSAAPAWADDAKQTLTYSAWTKVCVQTDQARGQLTCATHKEARSESGQQVLAATLIETGGSSKKTCASRSRSGWSCRVAPAS